MNIKSNQFYKEAESFQKGWGKYLKSIDTLKDSVDNMKDISLSDACWVLYGEGHCSSVWGEFQRICIGKKFGNRKMPWVCWLGLFNKLIKNYED